MQDRCAEISGKQNRTPLSGVYHSCALTGRALGIRIADAVIHGVMVVHLSPLTIAFAVTRNHFGSLALGTDVFFHGDFLQTCLGIVFLALVLSMKK